MDPLEPLYERQGLPREELPPALEAAYGGPIGFVRPRVIANFVASIDGVVDDASIPGAPSFISRHSEHDRFVMALLRACAGAVLIGGGTLRADPDHRWVPSHVFPEASEDLMELRRRLGLQPEPELVVVTASGEVEAGAEAVHDAVILTTDHGAEELRRRGVRGRETVTLGSGTLDPASLISAVRQRGHEVLLSEAGPNLTAQLLRDGLLDELFLTVSPVLLGRGPDMRRAGLAEGLDLVAGGVPVSDLVSVRRGGSHLFLRYDLAPG